MADATPTPKTYHVTATWDADARVWVSSSDVPGLVIEAASLDEFKRLAKELAPELLAENGEIPALVLVQVAERLH